MLAGAEAVVLNADFLLPLVRAALMGSEREAREWADILDEDLAAEREAAP